jgi:muramoyltetrapeptide carboxypeptidase
LTRAEPLGPLACDGLEVLKSGEARGVLLGGTLTQLVASLGTPFAFDPPPGFVLLVDEVAERPYRLDRMLTQLALAGILGRAAGIVFGQLPGCDEPGGQPTARATVADVLRDFTGPLLFGLATGHTTAPALTVPLGVQACVLAGRAPALLVEEAAVEEA